MIDLRLGDCLDVLRTLPDCSVDSVVTDPPYGLSFMGKRWDYDVPSTEVWAECLRVLKPGGHLLAFAGTRTQHRMAVRIEDAGFEIRDMIAWIYGSGFPKSLDVSKAIDAAATGVVRGARGELVSSNGSMSAPNYERTPKGDPITPAAIQWQGWGTALKPALEPITVARKPLCGTVAANVLAWGTGAINVDGGRVPGEWSTWKKTDGSISEGGLMPFSDQAHSRNPESPLGRFPANLIHDGSDEVVGLFPESEVSGSAKLGTRSDARPVGLFGPRPQGDLHNDSGSAARFFACFPPESGYGGGCQDRSRQPSNAPTVPSTLSLQSVFASTAQSAVAIWPHLAGTLSSEPRGASTAVTLTESKAISETAMQVIASIASGYSQGSQQERLTPCGSLVRSAAAAEQTGITRITISLLRSDGSAEAVTFSITPTNLERGEAASRFRYCAKASKADRDEGCGALPMRSGYEMVDREEGSAGLNSPRAGAGAQNGARNFHPTVKPTELMRYLCRLVTQPGGTVLDPFMGSGSTGKAAMAEGFRFVGIERDPDYFRIAEARVASGIPRQMGLF